MSNKTKRLAKGLGASALAAATIASGLSFGSAAIAAEEQGGAANSQARAVGDYDSAPGPLVFKDPTTGKYWATSVESGDFRSFSDQASAAAFSEKFIYNSRTGQLQGTNRSVCMTADNYFLLLGARCDPRPQIRFEFEDGHFHSEMFPGYELTGMAYQGGRTTYGVYTNDGAPFEVVEAPAAPLNADWTFQADVDQRSLLSGTGEPGAAIVAENASGDEVATTTVDDDGNFSVEIDAPNAGGTHELIVKQSDGDSDLGTTKVELDYGKAVAITGPEDQEELPAGATAITGEGEPGSMVQVYDNAGRTPVVSASVRANGTWSGAANLGAGQHQLEARQLSKGANTTSSTITVNPSDGALPAPTAEVEFGNALTDRATVTGAAQNGATVTIRDEDNRVVGTPQVVDGRYSQVVDSPGAGEHTFSVTQQVDSEVSEPAEATGDFGAALAVTALPAQSAPGDVTVAGTGENGASVTVRAGSQTKTATVEDGRWSVELELAPSNAATQISVSQTAQGNTITTGTTSTTANGAITARPVEIVEPSNHQYTPMAQTVLSGTATPYATVKIETNRGGLIRELRADKNGDWSFSRAYGPSNVYTLIATQTRFDGTTSRSGEFVLNPVGAFRPLAVTSHSDGGQYTPGNNTFRGTATPDAMVRITNQWGRQIASAQADANGAWSAIGALGPTADYTLTFTQTAPNSQQDSVTMGLSSSQPAYENAALTSPTNDSTYRPGVVTFTGTGSEGTEIVAKNQWGTMIGTATVNANGQWAFDRNLGPTADYQITFTAKRGTEGNTFTVNLNSPKAAPLVITSPNVGDTYTPNQPVTFTGTATPFASIDVKTTRGGQVATATANEKGEWSFRRAFGPTNTYELVFTQTDVYGDTQAGTEFTFAPNPTK